MNKMTLDEIEKEEEIEKCLIRKNPKNKLIKNCIEEFGLTENPCEGGFLLENGKLLDFSGKKEGGIHGVRGYDHRDIGNCIESKSCKNVTSHHELRLIGKYGNAIRFHGSGCSSDSPITNVMIYKDQKPTEEQWRTITNSVKKSFSGRIVYDIIDEEGDLVHFGSLEAKNAGRLRLFFESLV
jgi:hypothetical protein